WVRELFTLAVARDIYAGAPAIYVNYLDYDVLSHAYGPRHGRALRSLRRVDAAIKQIWRVCRRVPEHGYDLYVLSDHGQALCTPFAQVAGGRRFERVIFEDFFTPHGARAVGPERPAGRHHLASGIKALRMGRAPGFFQRFFNYIEEGFPWVLGEVKEARERDNVRVICAGPNAFIYFVDDAAPLAPATSRTSRRRAPTRGPRPKSCTRSWWRRPPPGFQSRSTIRSSSTRTSCAISRSPSASPRRDADHHRLLQHPPRGRSGPP